MRLVETQLVETQLAETQLAEELVEVQLPEMRAPDQRDLDDQDQADRDLAAVPQKKVAAAQDDRLLATEHLAWESVDALLQRLGSDRVAVAEAMGVEVIERMDSRAADHWRFVQVADAVAAEQLQQQM